MGRIKELTKEAARIRGASALCSIFLQFNSPGGSGIVVIAESCMARIQLCSCGPFYLQYGCRLIEEDPTTKISRDEQAKEIILPEGGQVHIDIQVELFLKYENITVNKPSFPYRVLDGKPHPNIVKQIIQDRELLEQIRKILIWEGRPCPFCHRRLEKKVWPQ